MSRSSSTITSSNTTSKRGVCIRRGFGMSVGSTHEQTIVPKVRTIFSTRRWRALWHHGVSSRSSSSKWSTHGTKLRRDAFPTQRPSTHKSTPCWTMNFTASWLARRRWWNTLNVVLQSFNWRTKGNGQDLSAFGETKRSLFKTQWRGRCWRLQEICAKSWMNRTTRFQRLLSSSPLFEKTGLCGTLELLNGTRAGHSSRLRMSGVCLLFQWIQICDRLSVGLFCLNCRHPNNGGCLGHTRPLQDTSARTSFRASLKNGSKLSLTTIFPLSMTTWQQASSISETAYMHTKMLDWALTSERQPH